MRRGADVGAGGVAEVHDAQAAGVGRGRRLSPAPSTSGSWRSPRPTAWARGCSPTAPSSSVVVVRGGVVAAAAGREHQQRHDGGRSDGDRGGGFSWKRSSRRDGRSPAGPEFPDPKRLMSRLAGPMTLSAELDLSWGAELLQVGDDRGDLVVVERPLGHDPVVALHDLGVRVQDRTRSGTPRRRPRPSRRPARPRSRRAPASWDRCPSSPLTWWHDVQPCASATCWPSWRGGGQLDGGRGGLVVAATAQPPRRRPHRHRPRRTSDDETELHAGHGRTTDSLGSRRRRSLRG